MTFYLAQIQDELARISGLPVIRPASVGRPEETHLKINVTSGLEVIDKTYEKWDTNKYNTWKKQYGIEIELYGEGHDEHFEDDMGYYSNLLSEQFNFQKNIPLTYTHLDKDLFNKPEIAGDTNNQISSLTIRGLLDDENSDENKLYWELEDISGTITLTFYRDSAKTIRVLQGEVTANGTMTLSGLFKYDSLEENHYYNSGLSATCTIAYTANDTDSANIMTVNNYYLPPAEAANFGITILMEPETITSAFQNTLAGSRQYTFSQKWIGKVIIHTTTIMEVH